MTKSVQIQITKEALETLKGNHYKLCFAKKVKDVYDVVWQSFDEYLDTNTFSWTPVYQVFGTNTFQTSVQVQVSTNVVTATLNQQVTMDAAGNLSDAVTGGSADAVTFVNNYGLIHPGLNSVSTGPDGIQRTTPIYVAPDAIETGADALTPVEMLQVWFAQDLTTSTMISKDVSKAIEIDLTEVDSATRLYDGSWSTPSALESGDPKTYLLVTVAVVGTVVAGLLATKIGTYLTGVYQKFAVKVNPSASSFTITYSETRGLNAVDRQHLALLASDPTTPDTLVEFVIRALAASGCTFSSISTKVPA